eukprot:2219513-Pyramimonas_sp.AAC.1
MVAPRGRDIPPRRRHMASMVSKTLLGAFGACMRAYGGLMVGFLEPYGAMSGAFWGPLGGFWGT